MSYCENQIKFEIVIPYFVVFRGADTTKQALGMLEIHFLNLGLAAIVVEKECVMWVFLRLSLS